KHREDIRATPTCAFGMEERLNQLRTYVTLYDLRVFGVYAWKRRFAGDYCFRILEVKIVVRTILRVCHYCRNRRASSARSTRTLLVVLPKRRNVSQSYGDQGANINPNLHRRR